MVSSFGSEYLDDNLYLLIPCYIHFKAAFIFSNLIILFCIVYIEQVIGAFLFSERTSNY